MDRSMQILLQVEYCESGDDAWIAHAIDADEVAALFVPRDQGVDVRDELGFRFTLGARDVTLCEAEGFECDGIDPVAVVAGVLGCIELCPAFLEAKVKLIAITHWVECG